MRRRPLAARRPPAYPDFQRGRVLLGLVALAAAPLTGCDRIQALLPWGEEVVDPEPIPLGGVAPRRDTAQPLPDPPPEEGEPVDGGATEKEPPIPELQEPQARRPMPEPPKMGGSMPAPREPVPPSSAPSE